jgi:hypothetical protein
LWRAAIFTGPSTGRNFAGTRTCLIITPATRAQCLPRGKAELQGKFAFFKNRKTFFASYPQTDRTSTTFTNIREALSFSSFWLL